MTAYKWFNSFLRLRTEKVKDKNAYSSEDMLQYGVPQCSVFGPCVDFNVKGFADDHQLRRSSSTLFQVTSLGEKIQKCFENN